MKNIINTAKCFFFGCGVVEGIVETEKRIYKYKCPRCGKGQMFLEAYHKNIHNTPPPNTSIEDWKQFRKQQEEEFRNQYKNNNNNG